MAATPEQLEQRIAQLEARELTVRDLPMQALKNDLQDSWSVEGSRLVARRSIRPESLALTKTVGTMPAVGEHGQEVVYATSTAGVNWRFKYNAASASSYKWEFIGGPPLAAYVDTDQSTTSTTAANLSTDGPAITVPLAGEYECQAYCLCYGSAAAIVQSYFFAVNGTAITGGTVTPIGRASTHATTGAFSQQSIGVNGPVTVTTAGHIVKMQYATTSGTSNFALRRLILSPKRVTQ